MTHRAIKTKLKSFDKPSYNRLYLKTKRIKRSLSGKNFKFVTIEDASVRTMEWIKTFPRQYDLIIEIPRSGMLIASIIALKLGRGLTTPDQYREGKFWHSVQVKERLALDKIKQILLVDDAADTGRAMSRAMEQILSVSGNIGITGFAGCS